MAEWILTILAALVGLYVLLPALVKGLLRLRFLRRIRKSGCVCLTFDDGPSPKATPQILALLRQAGARATFFIVGEAAEKCPELVAAIAHEGHELGEHGYGHLHAWKSNPLHYAADLARASRMIRHFASRYGSLFRPPYGKLNLLTLLYALLTRRRLAFWDLDPRDYAQTSPARLAQQVLSELAPGRVVLFHDGRRRPESDPAVTVEALKLVLEAAAPRRLEFATVSEALARARGTAAPADYPLPRRA